MIDILLLLLSLILIILIASILFNKVKNNEKGKDVSDAGDNISTGEFIKQTLDEIELEHKIFSIVDYENSMIYISFDDKTKMYQSLLNDKRSFIKYTPQISLNLIVNTINSFAGDHLFIKQALKELILEISTSKIVDKLSEVEENKYDYDYDEWEQILK